MSHIPDAFRKWLNEQLELRNLPQSEASRRAGLNQNAISDLFTGKIKRVSLNTAMALSKLFNTPLVEVLRLAGYIEGPTAEDDLTLAELIQLARLLSNEERREVLDYVRWKIARR